MTDVGLAPASAGVPHRTGVADLGDVRLAYQMWGEQGPWITLVHGGLVGASSWRPQLPTATKPNLLAAGRVLGYDQRGYGTSSPGAPCDVHTFADDLLGLWDALGIDRTVAVGFSMGGLVALEAAARPPDRVAALVLEGCAGPGHEVREVFRRRADALAGGDPHAEVREHVRRAFSPDFVEAQPEFVERYLAVARRVNTAGLAETLRSIAAWQPSPRALALDCAVLVVSGELDPAFGPGPGAALCTRLLRAEHALIPGAGHTAHCERAPAFNHLVTDFVRRAVPDG